MDSFHHPKEKMSYIQNFSGLCNSYRINTINYLDRSQKICITLTKTTCPLPNFYLGQNLACGFQSRKNAIYTVFTTGFIRYFPCWDKKWNPAPEKKNCLQWGESWVGKLLTIESLSSHRTLLSLQVKHFLLSFLSEIFPIFFCSGS